MTFRSLVENASLYSSIPFAIIGFGITYWQLIKTRNAAQAATQAAYNAQRQLARNHIIILLHQLPRAEEELDRAISSGSVESTAAWLNTWRVQAGQLRGLLKDDDGVDPGFSANIQSSIVDAAGAKDKILRRPGPDLSGNTRQARTSIGRVTNEIGELMSHYSTSNGVSGAGV